MQWMLQMQGKIIDSIENCNRGMEYKIELDPIHKTKQGGVSLLVLFFEESQLLTRVFSNLHIIIWLIV